MREMMVEDIPTDLLESKHDVSSDSIVERTVHLSIETLLLTIAQKAKEFFQKEQQGRLRDPIPLFSGDVPNALAGSLRATLINHSLTPKQTHNIRYSAIQDGRPKFKRRPVEEYHVRDHRPLYPLKKRNEKLAVSLLDDTDFNKIRGDDKQWGLKKIINDMGLPLPEAPPTRFGAVNATPTLRRRVERTIIDNGDGTVTEERKEVIVEEDSDAEDWDSDDDFQDREEPINSTEPSEDLLRTLDQLDNFRL